MKKVLSMALALMMILSLFAVPTMAAAITVENIVNGDMTGWEENRDLTGTNNATQFGASSVTANNADSKVITLNGNKVMQLAATSSAAELRTNTFDRVVNRTYNVSADVYLNHPYSEKDGTTGYFSFAFSNANQTATATTISWQPVVATAPGMENKTTIVSGSGTAAFTNLPINTWINISTTVTVTAIPNDSQGKPVNTIALYLGLRAHADHANKVLGYVDNVSMTHGVEAASVTKTVTGNGTMTGINDVVELNTSHTLTLTPASTSYLQSLTIDGTDVTENVTQTWDSTLGNYVGTYDVTVAADTTIVATYADYTMVTKVDEDMEDINYEIGSLTHGTTTWGKSKDAVATIGTDATYGQYIKVTGGDARTPQHTMDLGLYKFSFDAKADTAGEMKLQHSSVTSGSTGNGKYNGNKAGAGYLDVTTSWAHYDFMFEITAYAGTHTAETNFSLNLNEDKTKGLCLDNVKIVYYSKTAPQPPVVEPTEFAVTINSDANANIALIDAVVEAGEATTFTVAPKFGYYIQSITVGGTAIDVLDAYKGGTYTTGAISADTAIVVTVAELSANTDVNVSTDVATLPAVFAPAADTAVTFGKVLDNAATEYGIYLTNAAGEVKTVSGVGPYFAADIAKGTANGQFAIEFIGLEAGTYTAKTYVVVGGETTFGVATTFVVAE